jgi:CheY-like chemotaxis protein
LVFAEALLMRGKILLVDDNEAFIDSVKGVLEDEGYRVSTVTSGKDALSLTERIPFDLLLMDIRMPGMDGVESFIKMKAQNPDVRVILFTAYALSDLIQKADEEGVRAVLKKPLDMREFLSDDPYHWLCRRNERSY